MFRRDAWSVQARCDVFATPLCTRRRLSEVDDTPAHFRERGEGWRGEGKVERERAGVQCLEEREKGEGEERGGNSPSSLAGFLGQLELEERASVARVLHPPSPIHPLSMHASHVDCHSRSHSTLTSHQPLIRTYAHQNTPEHPSHPDTPLIQDARADSRQGLCSRVDIFTTMSGVL